MRRVLGILPFRYFSRTRSSTKALSEIGPYDSSPTAACTGRASTKHRTKTPTSLDIDKTRTPWTDYAVPTSAREDPCLSHTERTSPEPTEGHARGVALRLVSWISGQEPSWPTISTWAEPLAGNDSNVSSPASSSTPTRIVLFGGKSPSS